MIIRIIIVMIKVTIIKRMIIVTIVIMTKAIIMVLTFIIDISIIFLGKIRQNNYKKLIKKPTCYSFEKNTEENAFDLF